jgi:hypothetical protein
MIEHRQLDRSCFTYAYMTGLLVCIVKKGLQMAFTHSISACRVPHPAADMRPHAAMMHTPRRWHDLIQYVRASVSFSREHQHDMHEQCLRACMHAMCPASCMCIIPPASRHACAWRRGSATPHSTAARLCMAVSLFISFLAVFPPLVLHLARLLAPGACIFVLHAYM